MCLLLFLTTQPQGFHDLGVRCRVAADLIDDGEASGVVPHGPTNPVLLESSADVGDPAGAIGGVREAAIGAELVASHHHMMLCCPCRSHGDLAVDALSAPAVFAITKQTETRRIVSDGVENLTHGFRARGIWNIAIELEIWTRPTCALVCKLKRIVVMKVINDVPIGVRLERQQLPQT